MSRKSCYLCDVVLPKDRKQKVALYDKKAEICRPCSVAEAFVNVTESYCILQGNSPKSCGIALSKWKSLVSETRRATTDRLMKQP